MSFADDWNADMDAWGLTAAQRRHHLNRLATYRRARRTAGVPLWMFVTAVAALVLGMTLALVGEW